MDQNKSPENKSLFTLVITMIGALGSLLFFGAILLIVLFFVGAAFGIPQLPIYVGAGLLILYAVSEYVKTKTK